VHHRKIYPANYQPSTKFVQCYSSV